MHQHTASLQIIMLSFLLVFIYCSAHAASPPSQITISPEVKKLLTPGTTPKTGAMKMASSLPKVPGMLTIDERVFQQIGSALIKGEITGCSIKSHQQDQIVFSITYRIEGKPAEPVYSGAWVYNASGNRVDTGYKPAAIPLLPSGTLDLIVVLPKTAFTSVTIEPFLISSGKEFGGVRFQFPFSWNGSQGQLSKVPPANGDNNATMQQAARELFCRNYATAAIEQYHIASSYNLPGITPPVWSNDHTNHYNWCLRVDQNASMQGDAMRVNLLLQRLPSDLLTAMKIKGVQVPGLNPGRGP